MTTLSKRIFWKWNCGGMGLWLAFLFWGGLGSFAAELRVTGKLTLFAYPADTNAAPFRTVDFTLTRNDCRWDILLTNYFYREYDGPLAIRYFTDCEETTTITYWPRKIVERERDRQVKKNPSLATEYKNLKTEAARVVNGPFPKGREPIEIAPWIGFCLPLGTKSGETNTIPSVFLSLAWLTNQIAYRCNFIGSSDYPQEIVFMKPGIAIRNTPNHDFEQFSLPKPYDQGYDGLVFTVTAWDKDHRIPKSFIQTIYDVSLPSQQNATAEPQRVASVIVLGEVLNATEQSETNTNLPVVPNSAIVVDTRTNISSTPIAYDSKEFGVLDPKDPKMAQKVQQIRAKLFKTGATPNPYALTIVLLLAILPAFVLLCRKKTK